MGLIASPFTLAIAKSQTQDRPREGDHGFVPATFPRTCTSASRRFHNQPCTQFAWPITAYTPDSCGLWFHLGLGHASGCTTTPTGRLSRRLWQLPFWCRGSTACNDGAACTGSNTAPRTAAVNIANPGLGATSFSTSIAYSTSPTVISLAPHLTGDGPSGVTVTTQPTVGSAAVPFGSNNTVSYTASSSSYSPTVTIQYRTNACSDNPQFSGIATITVNVSPPAAPTFTTPATNPGNATAGFTGVAYSYSVAASSTNTAATFSLSAGSLPPALSLASNGAITGP